MCSVSLVLKNLSCSGYCPGYLTNPDKNPELIILEGLAFLIKKYDPSLGLPRHISSNIEATQKERAVKSNIRSFEQSCFGLSGGSE